jgi:predicted ATPase
LPVELTPLIGRSDEIQRLQDRLQTKHYRLATIVGEGGVGKTRLALAAANLVLPHFAEGVWFVPLAGLAGSVDADHIENQIATAVATALNFTFSTAQEPKEQLINYLRRRHCLLLLDNFESLLAGAGFVPNLLTAAPG